MGKGEAGAGEEKWVMYRGCVHVLELAATPHTDDY